MFSTPLVEFDSIGQIRQNKRDKFHIKSPKILHNSSSNLKSDINSHSSLRNNYHPNNTRLDSFADIVEEEKIEDEYDNTGRRRQFRMIKDKNEFNKGKRNRSIDFIK